MIKIANTLLSLLAFSAYSLDNWPDATLLVVNNSGYQLQVQIPQQPGLARKIISLSDDENQQVTVKIPMDVSLELRTPKGELKTSYCEVNLPQVLEEDKNEIIISAASCPNSSPNLICRQSKKNK